MNVIHVFNIAGVPPVIAKYQSKIYNWKSRVIIRLKNNDFARKTEKLYEFHKVYAQYYQFIKASRVRTFLLKLYLKSLNSEILHVHTDDYFASILFRFPKLRKQVKIIHYHGTDIRGRWVEKRRYYKHADLIFVSTRDLLKGAPDNVFWIPNPVDTEHFKPMNLKRKEKAILFLKHGRYKAYPKVIKLANKISREYDIDYELIDCTRRPVKYKDMPKLLNQYKYMLDIHHGHFGEIIRANSYLALQAMACGCKTISWSDEAKGYLLYEKLPEENKPENVIKRIRELLESKIR